MKSWLAALLLLCAASGQAPLEDAAEGSLPATESPAMFRMYEQLRETIFNIFRPVNNNQNLARSRRMRIMQDEVPADQPFPCDVRLGRSATPPDSVHRLRPGDIDVVAAMGDSLTASFGNAATNVLQLTVENRGMSWDGGGEGDWRQYLTLPNILKEFNPRLIGFSLNDSLSHQRASQFNVAEGGAMSRDLPWQAKLLVKRMRADPRVDFENHWKLVTMMVGDNDFCLEICYNNQAPRAVDDHRRDLLTTIDYLRQHLPRTLINVVVTPNLQVIANFTGKSSFCWLANDFECPCIFGLRFQQDRDQYVDLMRRWQKADIDIAVHKKYAGLQDFAVVSQPFTKNVTFPQVKTANGVRTDYSFLSRDCFHFSQKGNARAANALWNNLLEPVGSKSTDWQDTFSRFLCPTQQQPFIFTNENSRT